jgi:hypothetical protein
MRRRLNSPRLHLPHRSHRRGFAYFWAIVTVAVAAALAATAAPQLARINDIDRVTKSISTLRTVGTAIIAFRTAIHSTTNNATNNFPGEISELATPVRPTIDKNSCWSGTAGNMTAHDSTDWTTNGPFLKFMVSPGHGLWTPIGLLRDSIPSRVANGAMFIEMPGVERSDAALFKALVDSNATTAGDTVTVTAGSGDTVTIRMRLFLAGQFNNC